jgi:hypothetical protein
MVFEKATRSHNGRRTTLETYHYRYPVQLKPEQRRWLETMVHTSRTPAKHYLVARVLLMSDQNSGESGHTDGQIAEVLSISRRTVIRIKQQFVQENLEVTLTGSFPHERPERRCLDGKGEAQLIMLKCICRKEGHSSPTLRHPQRGAARGKWSHMDDQCHTPRWALEKTNWDVVRGETWKG